MYMGQQQADRRALVRPLKERVRHWIIGGARTQIHRRRTGALDGGKTLTRHSWWVSETGWGVGSLPHPSRGWAGRFLEHARE